MIASTLHQTPNGPFWLPDTPNCGTRRDILAGKYDRYPVDILKPYIRPGSVVIDAGSNFGQLTVLFAELVGPTGHVYSIEANPDVYEVLLKNIEVRSCQNVTPILAAVWATADQTMKFPKADLNHQYYKSYANWGLSLESPLGYHEVPSYALDALADQDVSAIKIDTQGSDLQAMRGGRRLIAQHRPAILYEFEHGMSPQLGCPWPEYPKFVEEIGYHTIGRFGANNYLIVPK